MGVEVEDGLEDWKEIGHKGDDILSSIVAVASAVEAWRPNVLLYEDFILGKGGGVVGGSGGWSAEKEGLDSVRVITGVLLLARMWGTWSDGLSVVPFSNSVKSVFTDERMKKWHLWLQGKRVASRAGCGQLEGHATDAMRGVVWFLREKI